MAPVARTVADGQKDELPFFLCLLERLRAPREPVHRVVSVLPQVGAALFRQPVRRSRGRLVRGGEDERGYDDHRQSDGVFHERLLGVHSVQSTGRISLCLSTLQGADLCPPTCAPAATATSREIFTKCWVSPPTARRASHWSSTVRCTAMAGFMSGRWRCSSKPSSATGRCNRGSNTWGRRRI